MILKSMEYSEYEGTPKAWYIDKFNLGQINLVVGKNATGKTRVLNVIRGLGNLVCGEQKPFVSGHFRFVFSKDNSPMEYKVNCENNKVIEETLVINSNSFLRRGAGGKGTIWAEQLGRDIEFQTPENEVACVARRDSVQHPFFEDLYQWGKSLRHYLFGTQLGKEHLAVFIKETKDEEENLKQTEKVVSFLKKGIEKYGERLKRIIIEEMKLIGYSIEDIDVSPLPYIIIQGSPVNAIYVKEKDLEDRTYQHEISQGMFRALSLLIQINYSQLERLPSCILIDDIGEGLDFERSTSLIKLLIEKIKQAPIQLIMSTNDRFVMNNVPLEYWGVIQRKGPICKIYNYENSQELFEEFQFTGLSNFDFLATEYYLKKDNGNGK